MHPIFSLIRLNGRQSDVRCSNADREGQLGGGNGTVNSVPPKSEGTFGVRVYTYDIQSQGPPAGAPHALHAGGGNQDAVLRNLRI